MKRKIVALVVIVVMLVMSVVSVSAAYTGEDYYTSNNNYYKGYRTYSPSPWAQERLQPLYDAQWHQNPIANIKRGEYVFWGLRILQRAATRQGYSRLTSISYQNIPFVDLGTVNPIAQQEVQILWDHGLLKGYFENNQYYMRLSNDITRAEGAEFYVRFNTRFLNMGTAYDTNNYDGYMSYYNNNQNFYSGYSFIDTRGHWAEYATSIAASNGVIKGVGNNYFAPESNLTIEQAWSIFDSWVGYYGIQRKDVAYAMEQTFKVKCGDISSTGYYEGNAYGTSITSLRAETSNITMVRGSQKLANVIISPYTGYRERITWTSSNPSAVSIEEKWTSNGKASVWLRANTVGNNVARITATDQYTGKTASFYVSVTSNGNSSGGYDYDYNTRVTSMTLSSNTLNLSYYSNRSVQATLNPSYAQNKNVEWTSSNDQIAYIKDVRLSGSVSTANIATQGVAGRATITAKTTDGSNISRSISIYVSGNGSDYYDDDYTTYISYLTPSLSNLTGRGNSTIPASVQIYPASASNKNLIWTSSNPAVANPVNVYTSGNVSNVDILTGVAGNAVITARAADGRGASTTMLVTVTGDAIVDTTLPMVYLLNESGSMASVQGRMGQNIVIYAECQEANLLNFEVVPTTLNGTEGIVVNTERISDRRWKITIRSEYVSVLYLNVKEGAAVDLAGNASAPSNQIEIFVNAN